jgi:hypothetical protein
LSSARLIPKTSARGRSPSQANRAVVAVEACDERFFGRLGSGTPRFTEALRVLRASA